MTFSKVTKLNYKLLSLTHISTVLINSHLTSVRFQNEFCVSGYRKDLPLKLRGAFLYYSKCHACLISLTAEVVYYMIFPWFSGCPELFRCVTSRFDLLCAAWHGCSTLTSTLNPSVAKASAFSAINGNVIKKNKQYGQFERAAMFVIEVQCVTT